MSESSPGPERFAPAQAVAQVRDWWGEGVPEKKRLDIVSLTGTTGVLEEAHRHITQSVLLDATEADAEDVFRDALTLIGVPEDKAQHWAWRQAARRQGDGKLVLITHAGRAGLTRRSAQPALVRDHAAETLALAGPSVVLDTPPTVLEASPYSRLSLWLDDTSSDSPQHALAAAVATASQFPQLRALALSEPRRVPWEAWSELARAAGAADFDEMALQELAEHFSELVTVTEAEVSFADEAVAEALRRETPAELSEQVNRHMVRWLRELAPRLRHPDGWAASGPLGRYAARGMTMHAVQAGEFDELLRDGGVLANVPQKALLDAADCAHGGSVPGSNAAADAVYLWMYGVAPTDQGEWAAWLHLMATARNDGELCTGMERSGVRLPWKARWTHWRPPGGYDPSYLEPGPVDALFEVRWRDRPAVAAKAGDGGVRVWDAETSELVAGPWFDEDFPDDAGDALTWPPETGWAGPTGRSELLDHDDSEEGPDDELLPVALRLGNLTVFAGPGGVLAVEGVDTKAERVLRPLRGAPLLGSLTAAGPTLPKNAPVATAADLAKLFPRASVLRSRPEVLPAGLANETARRTLTDIGLPVMDEKGIRLEPDYRKFLWELPWPKDVEPPAENGPFFQIGLWMGAELVIDGPSGHVLRMPRNADESGLDGLLVATSLDRFLAMVAQWITGRRILTTLDNRDEEHLFRQHIEDALWEIDAAGSQSEAWTYALHND
ncbi:SUKH-4 family immunity protein [Streptomyces sp. NRRL S-474]|uniref:SUKH-4 family immunity protein n=1 Tax=Streptomyces sp. NRRL S-474 TaxID=1463909 RepID=UPI0004C4F832|nr:SUKH-4 family immunity protein [Streptomyces sp. NRRL S-474]